MRRNKSEPAELPVCVAEVIRVSRRFDAQVDALDRSAPGDDPRAGMFETLLVHFAKRPFGAGCCGMHACIQASSSRI